MTGNDTRLTVSGPVRTTESEAAPVLREAAPLEEAEERVSIHTQPGSFGWKLGKEFVVSIELAPPRGVNPAKMLAGAYMLKDKGVDAVNVTDSALGRASMSALAVGYQVAQQAGMTVIPHFTTRDRTLMGIQSELLGAHAMGLRHILALTGDAPNPVEQPGLLGRVRHRLDRPDQVAHPAEQTAWTSRATASAARPIS